MIDHDRARLSLLPQQLRDEGYEAPPYRYIRETAIDGGFEAHRVNGLWYYKPEHVAEIAASLRLKRRTAVSTEHSERQSVAAE